jgi:hypothetical protein
VAVVLFGVLHFFSPADDPGRVAGKLMAPLAPGSCLAGDGRARRGAAPALAPGAGRATAGAAADVVRGRPQDRGPVLANGESAPLAFQPRWAEAVRAFTFGSYNLQGGGFDDGQDGRLSRQLVLLADVRADAWVFQECSGWLNSGGRTLFLAEQILGLRGFLAPSSRHGGDLAVFVREPAGLRVTAERHEHGYPFWHAVARLVVATPWPGTSFHLVSGRELERAVSYRSGAVA